MNTKNFTEIAGVLHREAKASLHSLSRNLRSASRRAMLLAMTASALWLGGPQDAFAETTSADEVMQAVKVTGQVVDATGEPIIGASVLEKGTNNGVITNFEGKFTINVKSQQSVLKISFVGYKPVEVKASDRAALSRIELKEDSEVLDEVVVVGYGTQKKESLTGSVAVVGSKAFKEKGGLSSPLEALQGQVPGVMITRNSSAPGDESWSMSLRGSVSVNTTDPLIIIDGVAYNSVDDLRLLNSNDIESINFLKDGSAAIYGSRAAGGVVLITTKKGAQGKTKVEYSGLVTLKVVGLMPELMNLDQWSNGLMQCLENEDATSNVWYTYAQMMQKYKGTYIDLNNTESNPLGFGDVADYVFDDSVDWLGSLFGNTTSTEHNLSISGGGDKYSYRVSLSYLYDGSTLQYGSNNNQRYTFRMNNTFKLSKRVTLESAISYNRQEQVAPTMISSALTTSLPMPGLPLTSIDGKAYAWGTWKSPVAQLTEGGDNKLTVSSINISETLNYNITDWLDFNANVGYSNSNTNRDTVQNSITYYNYAGDTVVLTNPTEANSSYTQTNSKTDFYSFSGYFNAHKTFAKDHNFSLTLGAQYEFKDYTYFGVVAKNIQEGLEIVNGSGDITLSGSEDKYQYSNLSYFGRFNYNYAEKYLVELNGRYDGSSKFKSENRWEFFFGASAGWRIKQEEFMKDVDWLSELKLRLSYAEMGNQSGISNYDGVQLYTLNGSTGAYVGSSLLSYIATSGTLASNSRSWERIKNFNIAIDFGLFGGKLSGTVEAFLKKNDNMLCSITLPATLGDNAPTANVGKFKDWGYEAQITYNDRIGDVGYHVGGTFSFARNKLVDYNGTTVITSGYTSTQQGYPLNSIFGLKYIGKIQNEAQLEEYMNKYYDNNGISMPSNLRVGDNMFEDVNGDGVLDENDYVYLGSDTPEISYSFNAGIEWKGFDISVIFQGAANRKVYRGINNFTVPFRNYYQAFTTASIGNVWSEDNPDAYYSPYTKDSNIINYNYQASSLTTLNGSYIRLKNVTIGYTFPSKLLRKQKVLQNARIYVTGTDLWEATGIDDGWDPEAALSPSGTGRYPFTRNFTFGVNLTF